MRSKRNILAAVSVMFLLFACVSLVLGADPVGQTGVGYDAILKANPMPPGEKAQAIRIGGDATATLFVARFAQGAEVKPHFHKTHTEVLYVIEGTGRMIIDGKEIDIKPGSILMNPMGKVHSMKNTGSGEIVFLQIFTPEWKEPDRVFVP